MINDDGHAVSCLFPATYFNNGLEQYLQGAISPPCDYKLKYASALNAKGQVIVFGSKPSWPQLHPFLLTPIVAESPSMSGRLQRWDGVKWVPIKDWKDPEIHKEQPTVVITHGWNSSLYCREICSIASQLRTQNSRANILGWNWDSAAVMILSNGKITQDIFDEIYDSGLIGAAKCVQISLAEGNHMAKELQMLKIGPDNLQLIGHSAGASLIGSTASALYASCGGKVRRITALDAPCIVLSEIPQAGWNAPPAQTGLINIHEYDSKIFVKDEGLLSSRADALSHINPAHAYQFENYYSGPPGPAGRKALGFGLPVSKAGNVFNGQIFAGGMILKSLNIKPDHIRIVDWYANTINKKSEVGGFPAGLNWSILSREASNFKPGHYKEIGYDKGVFSNMEQK
jgi:pimeloyl-ACP methyl ester carboxylesterase